MESYEIIWKTTLPELERTVSSISFDTYILNLFPVDIIGNKIVLCTKSRFFAETIGEKMYEKIRDALAKANTEVTDCKIVVADSREDYLKQVGEEEKTIEHSSSPINQKLTFDSFVVGASNEFAYAAAKAVAENPGEAYNPLYVYGGTGLGKTHLLMAIANHLKKSRPHLNVLYSTCEQFTNQLIQCIYKGKGTGADIKFREKYRNVDVLLIDDVQFLAKKQATQEEFFHTFNELVMQNKQIVLTSDCPPRDIEVLEERLRTRFEAGITADMQPPSLETRVAILRKKSEEQKCLIDLKVLSHIAEMDEGDIRSLIGKLTKVIFFSRLHDRQISIALVDEALKESAGEKQEEMKVDDIIECVCRFYNINKNDMLSKKKNKEIVEPRQVCMFIISEMMNGIPLEVIGQRMGKNHSTVIYSRDKISEQMKTDKQLATRINDIKKMLLKQ